MLLVEQSKYNNPLLIFMSFLIDTAIDKATQSCQKWDLICGPLMAQVTALPIETPPLHLTARVQSAICLVG